jgi:hypothetical protein
MREMSVRYHVIPSQAGSWRVKRTGATRATSVHSTQTEAVHEARKLAQRQSAGDVIVHGMDGSIKSMHSYGSDPRPPRG